MTSKPEWRIGKNIDKLLNKYHWWWISCIIESGAAKFIFQMMALRSLRFTIAYFVTIKQNLMIEMNLKEYEHHMTTPA